MRLRFPVATTPGASQGQLGRAGRTGAMVLGARQVVQAAVTGPRPRAKTLWLGVAVDVTHALSMVGLARWARRYRRPALFEAAVASALAATGALAARNVERPLPALVQVRSLNGQAPG